jgi:hypothetical protein
VNTTTDNSIIKEIESSIPDWTKSKKIEEIIWVLKMVASQMEPHRLDICDFNAYIKQPQAPTVLSYNEMGNVLPNK